VEFGTSQHRLHAFVLTELDEPMMMKYWIKMSGPFATELQGFDKRSQRISLKVNPTDTQL